MSQKASFELHCLHTLGKPVILTAVRCRDKQTNVKGLLKLDIEKTESHNFTISVRHFAL